MPTENAVKPRLENFAEDVDEFNNEDLRKSYMSNISSKSKREPKTV